ncbi:hypothetical protein [Stenotrophomonas sp.]|uniref:hypothetical protein n=1 Tax=Stenotrophomonas sp. TaxID=69392 RepID=UPI00289B2473|nr:hypothetical protein [Stenotrophomonas sp.]
MRSDNNQLDIFEHDPRLQAPRLAKAYRESADEALKQYQFSASVRKDRHDHYIAEAERLEANARNAKRAARRRTRSKGAP